MSRLTRAALLTATALIVSLLPTVYAGALLGTDQRPRMTDAFRAGLDERPDDEEYGAFVRFREKVVDAEQLAVLEQHELHVTKSYGRFDTHYVIGTNTAFRLLADEARVAFLEDDAPITFFGDTSRDATRVTAVQTVPVPVPGRPGQLTGSVEGSPVRDAQGLVLDGSGVGVAVIDSGVDGTHPDLDDRLAGNAKVVCPAPVLVYSDSHEKSGLCYETQYVPVVDSDTTSGHGTHVAGIVAGTGEASEGTFKGVAPGASLYGIGVGEGLNILYAAEAYDLVLTHHATSTPPIKVVNNSWGCSGGCEYDPDRLVNRMVTQAAAEGVVSVFAVGNDGGDGTADRVSGYAKNPTPGVIAVANYDDDGRGARDHAMTPSSSRAKAGEVDEYPDVAAPGRSIVAACNHDKPVCNTGPALTWEPWYATLTGTSMASPHVAGIVALLLQGRPDLTPAEVEDLLEDTALEPTFGAPYQPDPANAGGLTSFDKGHGLVDARAAVDALGLQADGYPANDPVIEISSPDDGTSVVDSVTVTGTAGHAGRHRWDVPLADGDGGDEVEGLIDVTSVALTDLDDGITIDVGLRDTDHYHGSTHRAMLTVFGVVDGRDFAASAYLDPPGTSPRAEARTDGNSTFASAEPSEVLLSRHGVRLTIPDSELGNPGADAVVSSLRVATYRGAVRDVAPGGGAEDFVARPRFLPRFALNRTLQPVAASVRVWSEDTDGPGPEATVAIDPQPSVDEPWSVTVDLAGRSGTHALHAELVLGGATRATDSTTVEVYATASPPSEPTAVDHTIEPGPVVEIGWGRPASTGGAPLTGYELTRDGVLLATLPPEATSYSDASVTDGSVHDYGLTALNVVGQSPTVSFTASLANAEPLIPSITSPVDGDFRGAAVVVEGLSEPGAAIEVVDDGAVVATAVADSSGIWAAGYHTSSGVHSIAARARVGARRGALSTPVSFTVDGAPAQVGFLTRDGQQFTGLEGVRIEGAATDDAGVSSVLLGYRHGHAGPFDLVTEPVCSGCGSSTEATFHDEPLLAPGYYDVFAVVTDVAGNRSVARIGIYAAGAKPAGTGPVGTIG